MFYLLAAAVIAAVFWTSNGRQLRHANWRAASGLAAIGALTSAAFVTLRGEAIVGLILAAAGLGLMFAARWPRRRSAPAPQSEAMSLDEARSVLGVGPAATPADIREAYARLMRRAHPDHGGTSGLAAQLNAARDRLRRS